MKTLFVSILLSLFFNQKENANIYQENIYIYEYSSKIHGQAIIGFVFTDNSLMVDNISFRVFLHKNKIQRIEMCENKCSYRYNQNRDGNIYVGKINKVCYNSHNFSNKKLYGDVFYSIFSDHFLKMNNENRYRTLVELSHQTKQDVLIAGY